MKTDIDFSAININIYCDKSGLRKEREDGRVLKWTELPEASIQLVMN